jgi:putative transposase
MAKKPAKPDNNVVFSILRESQCAECEAEWKALPRCLGASSTVHDRFQEWQNNGTFTRFWQAGLMAYAQTQGLDWHWQSRDGALVKAPLGEKRPGRIPLTEGNPAPSARS